MHVTPILRWGDTKMEVTMYVNLMTKMVENNVINLPLR